MKDKLLEINLSEEYREGLIDYKIGLDNIPDWPMLQSHGWTFKEHLKLEKLIGIEHMKYSLNEAIEDDEIMEEEVKEVKLLIEKSIKEYNEM